MRESKKTALHLILEFGHDAKKVTGKRELHVIAYGSIQREVAEQTQQLTTQKTQPKSVHSAN
jgi:hypothetical protein